jgi:hypothetical protein
MLLLRLKNAGRRLGGWRRVEVRPEVRLEVRLEMCFNVRPLSCTRGSMFVRAIAGRVEVRSE